LPLSGFVWEEGNRIVGNLSLVPFFNWGQRIYMIANVAVHPDYRRRGIARRLGEVALEHVQRHGVQSVWLQVRDDNPAAFHLYQTMDFEVRARRTTWLLESRLGRGNRPLNTIPEVRVLLRRSRHWSRQQEWLKLNYPTELRWHMPLRNLNLQPGILGSLYRFFNDIQVRHWSAIKGNQLIGVLTWQNSRTYADHLWLATPPGDGEQAIRALLSQTPQNLHQHRPLGLDFPEGRAAEAFEEAGFKEQQTLIWMEKKL
jgi:hypothetical protein